MSHFSLDLMTAPCVLARNARCYLGTLALIFGLMMPLQADTPPPVVTAVLGHAAARTTAAHYLRLDTEHLRRCALDVEDVLDSGQGARL